MSGGDVFQSVHPVNQNNNHNNHNKKNIVIFAVLYFIMLHAPNQPGTSLFNAQVLGIIHDKYQSWRFLAQSLACLESD